MIIIKLSKLPKIEDYLNNCNESNFPIDIKCKAQNNYLIKIKAK